KPDKPARGSHKPAPGWAGDPAPPARPRSAYEAFVRPTRSPTPHSSSSLARCNQFGCVPVGYLLTRIPLRGALNAPGIPLVAQGPLDCGCELLGIPALHEKAIHPFLNDF